MKKLIIAAALCAFAAFAQAAGPRLAIVTGSVRKNHATEFDFALSKLGWKSVDRFESTPESMKSLAERLNRYDMILFTPLFNYKAKPLVLPGEDRTAFMKFLNDGGMIAVTDGTYPEVLAWVFDLDPRFTGLARGGCNSSQWNIRGRTMESEPPHPMRFFPWKIGEPNSWAHLQPLAKDTPWKLVASCNEGFPVSVCQRVGKGLFHLSALRQPTAEQLENFFANLQLARAGIDLKSFSMTEPAMGPGRIEAVLNGTVDGTRELVYTVTDEKGKQAVFSGKNEGSVIEVPFRHSFRGAVTETLTLKYDGEEHPIFTRSSVLPQLLTLRPNAYRGILSTKRRLPTVKFGIELEPDAEDLSCARVELEAYYDGKAKVAGETVKLSSNVLRRIRHPFALDRKLPAGDYTLKGTLFSAKNRKLAEAETTFKILEPHPGQTIIDEDLTFLVNGKPFFPIGIYHLHPNDYERAKEIGFNTVTFWAWHVNNDPYGVSRGLSKAAAYDLKAIVEFNHKSEKIVENMVAGIGAYPNLLMWYSLDEPSESHYAQCKMMQDAFYKYDENHPVYLLSCRTDIFAKQAEFCDVFGIDPYDKPEKILNWTTNAISALDGRKPLIVVPAAFENNKPEIFRSQLYLSIVSGARGLLWYPWSQMGGGELGLGMKNHPEAQGVVSNLCDEVNRLMPVLTHPERRLFTSGDGALRCMFANYNLIAVNATAKPIKAKATVPGIRWNRDLKNYFDKSKDAPVELRVRGGEFEIELEPYGVRVLR